MNSESPKYIAVEGAIGAGKTSLARMLATKLNARLILEQFEENPFLGKFYEDRKKYAFQTQMFFLVNRYKQLLDLQQYDLFTEYIVADYIFEKDRLFAELNLSPEELQIYNTLFPLLKKNIRKPDLVIFLHSSTDRLERNIHQRNREVEKHLNRDYLDSLSQVYSDYFFKDEQGRLLIVDSTDFDFVANKSDFDELLTEIFRDDSALVEYYKPKKQKLL
ncbi:MAG: deoxynucleoside kinase [Ignavibacteriaceae bacterium]|nr:deoxynucleoside kinase [Ignavibacteriaceae bacterium]